MGFAQDLRYGLRILRRNLGFTLVAALTLALGIGANTAIFSVADAFLLKPLPFPNLGRLAAVVIGQKAPAAAADYYDWKSQDRSFDELAAYRQSNVNLTGSGQPERLFGAQVTANFFADLESQPALGRSFSNNEDEPGQGQVAILSHGLWQRRFGADPNIAGRVVDLDGKPYTIVGVMPKGFEFPLADIWTPLALAPEERAVRATRNLRVIGRLKAGVTIQEAQAELAIISRQLEQAYPLTNKDRRANVMPLSEFVEGTITRAAMFLLLCAVGVVLLIACANIANLQLARATGREREIAVRTALGASRWRVVRLLLSENMLLALISGGLSLLFASFCLQLLLSSMPGDIARLIPGWDQIGLDGRALAFTLGIALLSGVLSGLAPALGSSRPDLNETLKEGGRSSTGGRSQRRLRSVFVVGQIAVALVLLVVAGLFVKGLRGMLSSSDVFEPQRVLVLSVNLPNARYADEASRARFYRGALERLGSMPGVQSAAAFSSIPLSNNGVTWSDFQIEGKPAPDEQHSPGGILQSVSPEFFPLLHIPIREGRALNAADQEAGLPVALVSQKLASRYFPHESALGKRIRVGAPNSPSSGAWLVVVGVTGDVLYDWTNRVPEAVIYRPVAQAPLAESQFAIRVNGDPAAFAQTVRAQFETIDPLLPPFGMMALSDAIHESFAGSTQIVGMMAILGMLALVIAVVGVYGMVAYAVAERMHEFGIRMALGAQRRDIFLLVMGRGALLAGVGLAIGIPSALAMAHLAQGVVFGASATDPLTYLGVAVTLLAVTFLACYVPAARATRVDPISALRYE
jgi:putative ABC transport system permease protein